MKGDLKKAAKLYKRSKYPQVMRLLEPQIFRYRQNFDYFYLLGMSCLHTGDLGGAGTYLQRGLGIIPNEIKATLGLAIVHLKKQEIQEAIRCYLEVLDEDPGNKLASRGMAILRKDPSESHIQHLDETGRLSRLLPEKRRHLSWKVLIPVTLIAASSVVLGGLWYFGIFTEPQAIREPAVEVMTLDNVGNIVDFSGEYRYVLTENEIVNTFEEVKKNFADFNDNMAQREINRLLGSNASNAVKERARIIAGYISAPDFTTVKNSFEYQLVAADPFLYSNTYVIWSGKLTNLAVSDENITFDLLVGYENNQVLLGVVTVVLNFAAFLNVGDAVEVLGQVNLNEGGEFHLKAVSIHKLQPKDSRN